MRSVDSKVLLMMYTSMCTLDKEEFEFNQQKVEC